VSSVTLPTHDPDIVGRSNKVWRVGDDRCVAEKGVRTVFRERLGPITYRADG